MKNKNIFQKTYTFELTLFEIGFIRALLSMYEHQDFKAYKQLKKKFDLVIAKIYKRS